MQSFNLVPQRMLTNSCSAHLPLVVPAYSSPPYNHQNNCCSLLFLFACATSRVETWKPKGADFVGTERTKNGIEATLGRLSFNIFEPTEVPVLLTSVTTFMRLPSAQAAAESPDADDANYGIASNFVTRDGSELRGRVVLLARCTEDSSEADRMQIQFLRTKLEPDESQDLDAWRAVIGRKAEDSEGADMLDGGVLSHEWTKSPLGTLDVLYVDEDVRITRGNMGALVVVTRM